MTCGACDPSAMTKAIGGRVFGYAARPPDDPMAFVQATKDLHYMGAIHVYADYAQGRVFYRRNLNRVLKVMREGDILLLSKLTDIGKRAECSDRNAALIEARGYTVKVLTWDA